MRAYPLLLIIGVVGWVAFAARAGDGSEPTCLDPCQEASSTAAIRECLAGELARAEVDHDSYLAAAFEVWAFQPATDGSPEERAVLDEMSRAIPETLRRAEEAWKSFMEADCAAVGAVWTTGSGRAGAVLSCRLGHVRRRTWDLWATYLRTTSDLPPPPRLCEDA